TASPLTPPATTATSTLSLHDALPIYGMNNMLNKENPYAPLFWNRDFFAKHRVVLNTVWELPFGRGRRFLNAMPGAANQVLGGWRSEEHTSELQSPDQLVWRLLVAAKH